MNTLRLFGTGAVVGTTMVLSLGPALAQRGPPGCNWKKYMYAQDATQQGKIDINLLNQMSAMASGSRLFTDQQGLAIVQRLAHGGQARQWLAGPPLCRSEDTD